MLARNSLAALLGSVLACTTGCDGCGETSSGTGAATATVAPGAEPASNPETPFPTLGIAVRLPPGAKGTAGEGSIDVEGAQGIKLQLLVSDDLTELGSYEQQLGNVDLAVKRSGSGEPKWLSKTKNPDGTWLLEHETKRADGAVGHSVNASYLAGKKAIGCSFTATADPQIRESVVLCKGLAPRAL